MMPVELKKLIEQQDGKIYREKIELAEVELLELGIPLDSEFAEVFVRYKPTHFKSTTSNEYICDISEPTRQVMTGVEFIHEVWELPDSFVCFTSLQGEGGYLLDKVGGGVWDFDLSQYDDFVAGKTPPTWDGFFGFMSWYLSPG